MGERTFGVALNDFEADHDDAGGRKDVVGCGSVNDGRRAGRGLGKRGRGAKNKNTKKKKYDGQDRGQSSGRGLIFSHLRTSVNGAANVGMHSSLGDSMHRD